jgi:preprotein translocase subunit SecD
MPSTDQEIKMYRILNVLIVAAVMMFGGALQAQSKFTLNAASDEAVAGWQKMQIEDRFVWVNPTPALTAADIQGAEPGTNRDYGQFVAVTFTEAGARKMRDLSTAQMNKLIAMVLDGKVIMAPKVRSVMSDSCIVTGKAPAGLSTDEVRRILTSINRR